MVMNKKIILFDWDDTLFSKTEYKKRLSLALANVSKIPEDEVWKFEEEYFESLDKSGDFRIDNFLKFISQRSEIKIDLTNFVNDNLNIYSGSVFSEVINVLNQLRNTFVLGVYSQGFNDLQRMKIKNSGLENYFDEKLIYINSNKLDPKFIATLPTESIIIDDKKEVIETLKQLRFDLELIWINRKDGEKMEGVKTIESLRELEDLI